MGRPSLGWGAGASLEWAPAKWIGFEWDFLYTRRVVGGPLGSQNEFTYLQAPFFFRFWPSRFFSFGLGPYVGYALGEVSNAVGGSRSTLTYASLGYTRWDWGAAGTLGFQLPIMKYWWVFVDGRFQYGFQNLEEVVGGSSVTSWMEISLWGGFRLGSF